MNLEEAKLFYNSRKKGSAARRNAYLKLMELEANMVTESFKQ